MHQPTLTVEQTLRFALRTKTPAKRLPEETKRSFREEVLSLLLKMLNIEHTRKTRTPALVPPFATCLLTIARSGR